MKIAAPIVIAVLIGLAAPVVVAQVSQDRFLAMLRQDIADSIDRCRTWPLGADVFPSKNQASTP